MQRPVPLRHGALLLDACEKEGSARSWQGALIRSCPTKSVFGLGLGLGHGVGVRLRHKAGDHVQLVEPKPFVRTRKLKTQCDISADLLKRAFGEVACLNVVTRTGQQVLRAA